MFEELNKRREAVASNIAKSFENDIEKARSGVYEDTPENRRLNRVGQQYGSKKKEEEPAGKSKSGGESGSYEHYAKQASDSALRRAAADDNAKPGVQEAAKKEIKRRKETNKKNQQNNSWADKLKNVDIPVNVVDENFNFMNAKFNHYGNSDFGFSFAGYKDAKTGKLDVDLDDIYGLEPDQINEIHNALKSKFEADNNEPVKRGKQTNANKENDEELSQARSTLKQMVDDEDLAYKFFIWDRGLYDESEVSKDEEAAFENLNKNIHWDYGKHFEWTDSEDADEYKKKMERKGFTVIDVGAGSDSYEFILFKTKKIKK